MKATMSIRLVSCATLLALFALLGTPAGRAAEKPADAEAKAQKAAEAWLALIDQEQYAKSWEESASPFREAVDKDVWAKGIGSVRGTVGKFQSRKLKGVQYATNLPGVPEGQYVVMQYDAVFANRPAVETITPMLDKDGAWRVSGYYVK